MRTVRIRASPPGTLAIFWRRRLICRSIERSNVEMTTEMVQLMLVQRAYAANAQLIQAADQLMSIANSLRR